MKQVAEKKALLLTRTEETAHFRLDDGQELRWENGALPTTLSIGQEMRLRLLTPEAAEKDQRSLAVALLNEILSATNPTV